MSETSETDAQRSATQSQPAPPARGGWREEMAAAWQEARHSTTAREALALSWLTIRNAPMLVAAQIILDMMRSGVGMLVVVVVGAALGVQLFALVDGTLAPGAILQAWTRPGVVLGLAGMFATLTALDWMIRSTTDALIWGGLRQVITQLTARARDGAEDETSSAEETRADAHAEDAAPGALALDHEALRAPWRISWSRAVAEMLPRALLWRAVHTVLQGGAMLLCGMLYVSLVLFNKPLAPDALLRAPVLGFFYAALLVWALLVGVVLQLVPTLYAREDTTLGEAIFDAAVMTVGHLVTIYRMAIFAFLVISPVVLCWAGVLGLQLASASDPGLLNATSSVRLFMDLMLSVSLAFAGVLWRGGTFYLDAHLRGELPALDTLHTTLKKEARLAKTLQRVSRHAGNTRPLGHIDAQTGQWVVSLQDLRPRETPNIFTFAAALGEEPAPPASFSSDAHLPSEEGPHELYAAGVNPARHADEEE